MKYCGSLSLADDSTWIIAAEDSYGADIADTLAKAMQLGRIYNNKSRLLILHRNADIESTESSGFSSFP